MAEWLSVKDAATRLGLSGSRVYQLRKAGVLKRNADGDVSAADVRTFARITHHAAMSKVGGPEHLALLAAGVRERLHAAAHSYPGVCGPAAIPKLNGDVVAALGFNCVTEAARPGTAGCHWCWSNITYRVYGGVDPGDTPVYRALFGDEPCPRDRERWMAREDALVASAQAGEIRRQKHIRDQAAQRKAKQLEQAEEQFRRSSAKLAGLTPGGMSVRVTKGAAQRTVTASAPATDDGADLIRRNIAAVTRRRDAALARGDDTYAATLNGTISRLRMDLL
jgi:hypothetical protein